MHLISCFTVIFLYTVSDLHCFPDRNNPTLPSNSQAVTLLNLQDNLRFCSEEPNGNIEQEVVTHLPDDHHHDDQEQETGDLQFPTIHPPFHQNQEQQQQNQKLDLRAKSRREDHIKVSLLSRFNSLHGPGSILTYRCQDGFKLVGPSTKTCESDGKWSPSEIPFCVPSTEYIYQRNENLCVKILIGTVIILIILAIVVATIAFFYAKKKKDHCAETNEQQSQQIQMLNSKDYGQQYLSA